MKAVKLIIAVGLLGGSVNAATVTVSAGLPSQGVTPYLNSVALPNFFVAVGNWDAGTSTFTTFANPLADTAKVNGAFTATGPASFNSSIIALFVGTGNSIATSTNGTWAVFTSTQATAVFPADVSQATGVTFAATTPAVLNVVGKGNASSDWVAGTNNFNIVPVPETSVALLGALGALGLLRRRR